MALAAEIEELAAMSEANVIALAYIEAAGGDTEAAVRYVVEDLLTAEERLSAAVKAVSHGYVRGELPPAATC